MTAPSPADAYGGNESTHDVVVVGGGHNGLTAAAYLARAGKSVILIERLSSVGGAAVTAQTFDGVDAWPSPYSYLVSLLPDQIIEDLGLRVTLERRRYSSYTPMPGDADGRGLLIDDHDAAATASSFARIGAPSEAAAFAAFTSETRRFGHALWPTLTQPLLTRSEARSLVGDDNLWSKLVNRPIGDFIEDRLTDDLVRGVVTTGALIGTFASAHDEDLLQNRCFLQQVIGQGTGEWKIPVGGMGIIASELTRAAVEAGVRIVTGAEVTAVRPDGEVRFRRGERERIVRGDVVLADVAPRELERLLGSADLGREPEGSQVKVDLLVKRLPRLRGESIDPAIAFGGTLHVNETYSQLETAYRGAVRGIMPGLLPCEISCHTLTDPSILDPDLAATGAHALSVLGLHTPSRWVTEDNNDVTRKRLQDAVLASIDSILDEPIEDLILTDSTGSPCISTRTTLDLEHELRLPGGNIFHGAVQWPFVEDDAELATAAQRWGVATRNPRILICGSGARRGGAVSGLGGHNAAMAVLESAL